MLFLGLGLVLLVLKYFEVGIVAEWTWWTVLTPFALAVVWWTVADHFGYSKRKAAQWEVARKQKRMDKRRADLGLTRTRH